MSGPGGGDRPQAQELSSLRSVSGSQSVFGSDSVKISSGSETLCTVYTSQCVISSAQVAAVGFTDLNEVLQPPV